MVNRNPNAPVFPPEKMNYRPSVVGKKVANTGEPRAAPAIPQPAPVAVQATVPTPVGPVAPQAAQTTVFEAGLPVKANDLEVPKAE